MLLEQNNTEWCWRINRRRSSQRKTDRRKKEKR